MHNEYCDLTNYRFAKEKKKRREEEEGKNNNKLYTKIDTKLHEILFLKNKNN